MSDKIPKIYKNKIDKLRTKVQKEFYYHSDNEINNRAITPSKISRSELLDKINAIFKRPVNFLCKLLYKLLISLKKCVKIWLYQSNFLSGKRNDLKKCLNTKKKKKKNHF